MEKNAGVADPGVRFARDNDMMVLFQRIRYARSLDRLTKKLRIFQTSIEI